MSYLVREDFLWLPACLKQRKCGVVDVGTTTSPIEHGIYAAHLTQVKKVYVLADAYRKRAEPYFSYL